jgi:hypothetical protein
MMEYLPGVIAYFVSAYICCASRIFIWKIAAHWSKIWVADASQASSQVLSLTFVLTALILFGIVVVIWSIASYINYRFTEKGFPAMSAAGVAIALAVSQNDWLNEIAAATTYAD